MPETASSKCFSAVLSRLLCSGGLPTHPSEQLIQPNTAKLVPQTNENPTRGPSHPGVVARLMGLDSFPSQDRHKERTLGDYFRSKSVNSIDFLSNFDPVKPRSLRQHRRVRTSVEFASAVLLLEEEFQATLMKEEKISRLREKKKKNINDLGIQERRKSVYGKNVESKERRKLVISGDLGLKRKKNKDLKERRPVMMKGVEELHKLKKKKKKRKSKILAHNSNFDFKKIHPQGSAPEVARSAISSRKHQPFQSANSQSQSLITDQNHEEKMKLSGNLCYKRMVDEIFMLTEESVQENWIYGMKLKFDNFEEICKQLGQEILEALLVGLVDELHFYTFENNLYN